MSMFLYFLILLKITPRKQFDSPVLLDSKDINCEDQIGEEKDFHNDKNKNNAYLYCDKNNNKGTILMHDCKYYNIYMYGSYLQEFYSYFIMVYETNLDIRRSSFITTHGWNYLISIETASSVDFLLDENIFIDHKTYDSAKASVIHSEARLSDFKNNQIINCQSQAFDFTHYTGCILTNNTIKNAHHIEKSALHFDGKGSSADYLHITNCAFIDCKGEDKPTIFISGLDVDIEIKQVTFCNSKNINDNNEPDFIIDFDNIASNIIITFDQCNFSNLECNYAAGGIGLWFTTKDGNKEDTNRYQSIVFKDSTFEHISHDSSSGGGAISFVEASDNNNNKNYVSIQSCSFYDISTTNSGGAIHFESKKELKIDDCSFEQIHSNKGSNSIYVKKSDLDMVTINSCKFFDCKNDQYSYQVELSVPNLEFNYNSFTFSDKNCGCVKLDYIGKHTFFGNTFTNAKIIHDNVEQGVGISFVSYDNPTYSITIENNTFENIMGTMRGRCIFIQSYGENEIELKNNTIQHCPAGGPLMGINFLEKHDSFKIETFNFIENTVLDTFDEIFGCTPQIWIQNTFNEKKIGNPLSLAFYKCNFIENNNPKSGGGLRFGSTMYSANIKVFLYECEFIGNIAENKGSAIYVQSYQGLFCQQCKFKKNKSNQKNEPVYIETVFYIKDPDSSNNLELPSDLERSPEITFSKCIFEDIDKSDANEIMIQNSANSPVEILECNFNDCFVTEFIISINCDAKQVQVNNCSFIFSNEDESSKAFYSNSNSISLLGNTFQKCNSNMIQFEGQNDNEMIELRENNFFDCYKGEVLDATFKKQPIIDGNNFMNISLNGLILQMKLNNNLDTIVFTHNTFCNFDMSTEHGGIGIQIENIDTNKLFYLTFDNCKFINNTNKNSINSGGALFCGTNYNEGNTYLTIKDCIFQENKHKNKGGSIYINLKNDIIIEKCKFYYNAALIGSAIYIEPDYLGESKESVITISDCIFFQNNVEKSASIYIEPGMTKSLKINNCSFEEDNALVIDNFEKNIDLCDTKFIKSLKESALILTQTSSKIYNSINIDGCIFDSCLGINNKCFYILIETLFPSSFHNCIICNLQGTGTKDYFGTFDTKEIAQIRLDNVSFINNTCDSLYGGGVGLKFIELGSLMFINCKFINNTAKQNKDEKRPSLDKDYFNGDGGAIQLGYICKMNDMNVLFSNCLFKDNKANRHGGALAIQTYYDVEIEYCVFENNIANYDSTSTSLLYNNYFDLKSEGRGGAIYVNPAYSYDDPSGECKSPPIPMKNLIIANCEFESNNAYDGFALYVEGDDPEIVFSIEKNNFSDNYDDINVNGAIITSEICTLTEEQLKNDNNFRNKEGLAVKIFSCVDHYGKTPTAIFSESNQFSDSNPFSYSKVFTSSNHFSHTIEFSHSHPFSSSKAFSATHPFSASTMFSSTQIFSSSDIFSSSSNEDSEITSQVFDSSSINDEIQSESESEASENESSSEGLIDSGSSADQVSDSQSTNEVSDSQSTNEVVDSQSTNEVVDSQSTNEVSDSQSTNEVSDSQSTNEVVDSQSTNEVVDSQSTNEVVDSQSTNEVVDSQSTNEVVDSQSTNEVSDSQSTNEVVDSQSTNEVVDSQSTNEVVDSQSTNEVVDSQSTNEVVDSQSTNEVVDSQSTNEVVDSQSTNEVVDSQSTNEVVDSQSTNEVVDSQSTNEVVDSQSTNEVVDSQSTNEVVDSQSTNEVVDSQSTNEVVDSQSTNEVVDSQSTNEASNSQIENEITGFQSLTNEMSMSELSEIGNSESSSNIDEEITLPVDPSDDPIGTTCIVSKNGVDTQLGNRCYYSAEDNDNSVTIGVLRTNFTDFKNESNGGAIYIFNCGFYIHAINFTRCISVKGGGGAIYIKDSRTLTYNITIDACFFTGCQAVFGGACYIYSSSDSNDVTINSCIFSSNYAYKRNSNYDDPVFYGGSSLFLTTRNLFVNGSKFNNNKGQSGSIKIYNKYDEDIKKINSLELDSKLRTIFISECDFENEEKSESSIFYINDKEGSKIELRKCSFKGRMTKDYHYIKGRLLVKDAPKIHIISCNFEKQNNFLTNQVIYIKKNQDKIYGLTDYSIIIYFVAFVLMVTLVVCKLGKHFRNHIIDDKSDDISLNGNDKDEDYENGVI